MNFNKFGNLLGLGKGRKKPHVVLIYVCNQDMHDYFKTKSKHPVFDLLPLKKQRQIAHKDFIPNNLLHRLAKRGLIRLTERPLLPQDAFAGEVARSIPLADVWIFALLSYSARCSYTQEFFRCIQQKADLNKIKAVNLTAHTKQRNSQPDNSVLSYPLVAKPVANGSLTARDSNSIFVIENQEEFQNWRRQTDKIDMDEYVLEQYRFHVQNRSIKPFLYIERWIYVCGDLTVGLRVSDGKVIKQTNSLTSYLRDPRLLAEEYQLLQRRRKAIWRLTVDGSMPLSFAYAGEASFWDPRYAAMETLVSESGVELCSVDVIEDSDHELHIVDYNEHTWESASEDLLSLWMDALWREIKDGGN